MAERDATRPQLDFPELIAELITQLRLTGQVGLLDFSDTVIPAFLIGSRGIDFGGDRPAFASASLFHGLAVAPGATTVILDTGALPAGDYDVYGQIGVFGTIGAGGSEIALQHRNAANTGTLAVLLNLPIATTDHTLQAQLPLIGYTLGLNQRLRVVSPTVAMTGGVITATLSVQIRPTP